MDEKIWFKVRGKWWYIREKSIAWYAATFLRYAGFCLQVICLLLAMVLPVVLGVIIADGLGY